jgi:hypothetical protein
MCDEKETQETTREYTKATKLSLRLSGKVPAVIHA